MKCILTVDGRNRVFNSIDEAIEHMPPEFDKFQVVDNGKLCDYSEWWQRETDRIQSEINSLMPQFEKKFGKRA